MDNKFDVNKKNMVTVSDDAMEACLYISRKEDNQKYTVDELQSILLDAGIKFGINNETLQNMAENEIYDQMLKVAEGKPCINGKDGEFEFFFRLRLPMKPKLQDDGSVNFLDMDLFEKVEKNQLVAKYYKATGGVMGYTVNGKLLLPRKGRDKPAIRGTGFSISEDNQEYRSEMDGKVEFINGKIIVSNLFTITGELNYTVGNVDFKGDVHIRGAVRNGMTVKATGNVTIDGVVEGAVIEAGKNILLRSGVVGNSRCRIRAGDSVYGKFIEKAHVKAEGIVSCNYLMNSEVFGIKGVEVYGKKSVIIGGKTESLSYLNAYNIGNTSEKATLVKVGINDVYFTKLQRLIQERERVEEEIKVFEENLKKESALHEKIIMGLAMKVDERQEISNKIEDLKETIVRAENAVISVKGVVYPGVNICVNLAGMQMKHAIRNVYFKRKGDKVAIYENSR